MQSTERRSLRALTLAANTPGRRITDDTHAVLLADLAAGSSLAVPAASLRDRTVLIRTEAQLPAVLAAIALDGIARRILLCPPDLDQAHLPAIMTEAGVDTVIADGMAPAGFPAIACRNSLSPTLAPDPAADIETEWVLFTSGTTGRPKQVVHTLASLAGPLDDGLAVAAGAVWSTFYDVRRYGGLQILLRSLIGGGSMVLSAAREPVGDFLIRAGAAGVTHISGTPSHWRRALMSPHAPRMAPAYVRLSGEVADQAILDHLHAAYPAASIAHAFASTEAGVGFDVRDGRAGFPAAYIGLPGAKAELRVEDGTLRIRSTRTASRYLGDHRLGADDGFVDTGDLVEHRGDRYFFMGRREGVINVGGLKIYPEEVEAVINQHPDVRMSRVWARSSPITGAIVAAEIVLRDPEAGNFATIREDVLKTCRATLPAHKVPATWRQVPSLPIGAAGKLVRIHA